MSSIWIFFSDQNVLVCLWGNSTDLSLLINMTEEQIKSLQSTGGDHLAATEKNILGNHLNRLWDAVKELRGKTGGRVDFVLDNAGFELYCDCVYGVWFRVPSLSFVSLMRSYSRFPHSERFGNGDSVPRQAVSLVRVRRDEERLGVAPQHHGLWPTVP